MSANVLFLIFFKLNQNYMFSEWCDNTAKKSLGHLNIFLVIFYWLHL